MTPVHLMNNTERKFLQELLDILSSEDNHEFAANTVMKMSNNIILKKYYIEIENDNEDLFSNNEPFNEKIFLHEILQFNIESYNKKDFEDYLEETYAELTSYLYDHNEKIIVNKDKIYMLNDEELKSLPSKIGIEKFNL